MENKDLTREWGIKVDFSANFAIIFGMLKVRIKKNRREREIQERAIKAGWEILSKGWPDFLVYKEETNEAIFLEVKRKCKNPQQTGLSKHQKRVHQILRNLGLNVKVVFID